MNILAIPRLRDEVVVRPFNDGDNQRRYVVAVDGNHFVVTPTIAAVLEETRNAGTQGNIFELLAQRVSRRTGTAITPEQVDLLLRERLPRAFFEPLSEPIPADGPLMFRLLLLSRSRLQPLLVWASRLFTIPVASALCAAFLALDLLLGWQICRHGIGVPTVTDHIWGLAFTLVGIFIHELGHLAACHRFGGQHGGIGVGLYWCLPAFYAEVHGAWTLPRRQRAAVDAGGVYLQCSFISILTALYLVTPQPALLSAIAWSHFLMLHTLNPVLKFDGYWLLSDLSGIHNLHERVCQMARALLRGPRPLWAELRWLCAFVAIAVGYFTYLLIVLGHNLGSGIAGFLSAFSTHDASASASLNAFGRGCLLAILFAMAAGVAVLIARAAGTIFKEK